MTERDSNESPELAGMRDGPFPPPSLEEETLRALRREGLIAGRRAIGWKAPLIAVAGLAASIALFSFGLTLGRMMQPTASTDIPGRTFALILREPPGLTDPAETPRLVEEYRRWAGLQEEGGRLVGGEKLDAAGRWLRRTGGEVEATPTPVEAEQSLPIGGYFLIRAENYDRAVRIAESCPHLKYGGTIEVRAIDHP